MQLDKRYGLLLTSITVHHEGQTAVISDVAVDTGSASTVLAIDALTPLGIMPSPADTLYRMYGIGGSEAVFRRTVGSMQLGERFVVGFEVEVSGMDYDMPLNGLIGLDFLEAAQAVIDVASATLEFKPIHD